MNPSARGSYRKKETIFSEFLRSCLGRTIIGLVLLALLFLAAVITCPSEETMREETIDNIRECIEASDSAQIDAVDEMVNNVSYVFTKADTTFHDEETMKVFEEYNHLEYYNHYFFSTMRIYNNFRVEGTRCAIGFFGIVIPTATFDDFLLRVGTMRKEYNAPVINNANSSSENGEGENSTTEDDYYGDNPDLGGVFNYDED